MYPGSYFGIINNVLNGKLLIKSVIFQTSTRNDKLHSRTFELVGGGNKLCKATAQDAIYLVIIPVLPFWSPPPPTKEYARFIISECETSPRNFSVLPHSVSLHFVPVYHLFHLTLFDWIFKFLPRNYEI